MEVFDEDARSQYASGAVAMGESKTSSSARRSRGRICRSLSDARVALEEAGRQVAQLADEAQQHPRQDGPPDGVVLWKNPAPLAGAMMCKVAPGGR